MPLYLLHKSQQRWLLGSTGKLIHPVHHIHSSPVVYVRACHAHVQRDKNGCSRQGVSCNTCIQHCMQLREKEPYLTSVVQQSCPSPDAWCLLIV